MRTIVAFLLTGIAAWAQGPDISQLQKNVAARPNNIGDRMALLNALTNRNAGLPEDKVRELRRQQILWLIEHHPDAPNVFEQPALLLSPRGRLEDAAGSAEAEGLWKELADKPGAKPAVVANAAIYLSAIDLQSALTLVEKDRNDPMLSRARGYVDAAAVLGLSGIGAYTQFATLASIRNSDEAKAARVEIEESTDPNLIGKAGTVLSRGQIENPLDVTLGDDDVPTLGERWLRRAIELAPQDVEWKTTLGQALQAKANRALDPTEKVRLFNEAISLVPDGAKPGILTNLAIAEFDAGDDASAHDHAEELLNLTKNANQYHIAQTVLGRVAAAKGDLDTAKKCLVASITMPPSIKNASFQPNFTLAQDIYDSGDKDAVLRFLEASRNVWKFDGGRIDRMISFVEKAPSADLVQLSRQAPGGEVIRHPAPAFEATDAEGNTWTREQLSGKVVALEFGSAPLAEKVGRDFAPRGAVFLKVQDEDTRRRFEVITDPTVVVIDKQGNVSGYRSGAATEADWRNEFESGFGRGPNPGALPAPRQVDAESEQSGGKITIAWQPVEGAVSYVVEWDSRDEKGWIFDRENTVRVIATADASETLDVTGFSRVRWRVFAVPRGGSPGAVSPWREIEGIPLTKIYK